MLNQFTLSSTGTTLPILTWNEQPVITFSMIDESHKREEGTASRNFRRNLKHFIDGEDYFRLTHKEIRTLDEFRRVKKLPSELVVLTLAGYTMLTKSLTDDLAWKVQRELVNSYFKPYKTAPQKAELTLDDILKTGHALEKTLVEIVHTKNGEIINVGKQEPEIIVHNEESTVLETPSWLLIVETFFDEIENGSIPEKMCQNMLLAKALISTNERHDCLFFRLSNLMAFLRKTPRFGDLMHESSIQTASILLEQLKAAGVLAFNGKMKEKGIPIRPNTPSDTNVKRVSHLVAIDLVVLEQNYGVVMPNSREIARNFN
jgi:hypothetical protein